MKRKTLRLASGILAASVFPLAGCDGPDAASVPADTPGQPDAEFVHPIPEALWSSDPTLPVFDVSVSVDGPGYVDGMPHALGTFAASGPVGAVAGTDELIFGRLPAGTVLSDGRIAVVDRDYGVVRLITSSLQPSEVIGGFGDGPGEFVAPVGLFEEPSGALVVINHVGNRIRLERFRQGPDGFGFHDRTLLPFLSDEGGHACTVAGQIFATGLRTSPVDGSGGRTLAMLRSAETVHEVDADGRHRRSLAPAYTAPFERGTGLGDRTDEDAVAYALAGDVEIAVTYGRARLACGASGGENRIWVAYSTLGEVHAFTLDGELQWIVRLSDMRFPQQVQRIYPFGTSVGPDPDQAGVVEFIGEMILVSPNLLAVQIVSLGRAEDSPDDAPYRTLFLDPVTGEPRGGFQARHRILTGGHGTAVLYREDPHPELAVVQLER